MLSRKSSDNNMQQTPAESSTPSEQECLVLNRRVETHLSAQSAELLTRRMAEIWSQAAQQITPLIERLRLDDALEQRKIDHCAGVVMQVHTSDREVSAVSKASEQSKRLRIVHNNDTSELL